MSTTGSGGSIFTAAPLAGLRGFELARILAGPWIGQVLADFDADVLVENFKVGGLARHGLDYASVRAWAPRLIYCSVTGFGQTGPRSAEPGYDFMIQGLSGVMSLTGEPGAEPQKTGVAFADIFTGLYGVIRTLR